MKYPFLPNINKTKILDNIELSLAQQLYLKQQLKGESKDNVSLKWERCTGQSFAQAILYIERLLTANDKRFEIGICDHHMTKRASQDLLQKIEELLSKDKTIGRICDYTWPKIKIFKIKNRSIQYSYLYD